MRFLSSKRIEQMRLDAAQKAQDTALEAADPKKGAGAFEGARDWSGNELPTGRRRRAKR